MTIKATYKVKQTERTFIQYHTANRLYDCLMLTKLFCAIKNDIEVISIKKLDNTLTIKGVN